jgi:hypothetical protein
MNGKETRRRGHPLGLGSVGNGPGNNIEERMHKLTMTARICWINTPRFCDNTGKRLPERTTSNLAGKIAIELYSDSMELVQVELPIFNGGKVSPWRAKPRCIMGYRCSKAPRSWRCAPERQAGSEGGV